MHVVSQPLEHGDQISRLSKALGGPLERDVGPRLSELRIWILEVRV
jgi:hypothetical protein